MPRGGAREGSGPKPRYGPTVTISGRVPLALAARFAAMQQAGETASDALRRWLDATLPPPADEVDGPRDPAP